ncbi:hypothetical protein DD238_007085 [Peronospora effusa]|uniref:Uncharacterized protein n=1 Tax=Peronospora effusa TaxID=542832 RepID=A0A3M6VAB6_9STRA|nr:hypothetical protein DD238_007085 [Peronospora effusa]RQM11828.1 hypothetical protein DD237_007465 [Peronospora effusa]
MSGRPYARNPYAPYAGPRDLEAILPHTFRLEVPICVRDAKQEAIRRAIRRRCIQKNWRKLISIRHCRRRGEGTAEKDVKESRNETKQAQQTNNLEEERDTVDAAKKQLQTLELKLQELTDLKHVKFQLLKDILVEEARSKTTGGGATASVTIAKEATCGRLEA